MSVRVVPAPWSSVWLWFKAKLTSVGVARVLFITTSRL